MSEPTTEAGRRLLRYSRGLPPLFVTPAWAEGILAIEAEAAALDVERLARATAAVVGWTGALDYHREWARKVASAYAAQGRTPVALRGAADKEALE